MLLQRSFLLSLLLIIGACASVPWDHPKEYSSAVPVSDETPLGEFALQWDREHNGQSGFFGLGDGIDALGARLRLMELAERSIDAQYFIVKKDEAGALFVTKLLRAADRGVRVRLLVDDIFSPGVDQPFSLLDSHPNVEVRLFNPVSRSGLKYWNFLLDFKRANRRMHNKSFTVDNAFTIVGGRNIGEEYFELDQDVKFDDFDLLAFGDVAQEVSSAFDLYWNSELAVPMEAFGYDVDKAELSSWREYIDGKIDKGEEGIYGQAVNSDLLLAIREGRRELIPADVEMVSDPPQKLLESVGEREFATLAVETGQRFRDAREELIIITPYFVPLDSGVSLIKELIERGVRVMIITNSLASTNHVAVYSGYQRYRKQLLEAGAEMYEIRAHRDIEVNAWGHAPDKMTLHSKATIIDREVMLVGSLNIDPRSIMINSEMGLFVESERVAGRLADTVLGDLARTTYRVDLDEKGRLRWTYVYGDIREVLSTAPQTSLGRRNMARFYGLLPIEEQL